MGVSMPKSRESWVDNIKVFACILVALGHFMQSMTGAGLLTSSGWTRWFNETIYLFHVPLFFLCSGFVYQKYSRIRSMNSWAGNILKKLITLGVPYFVFSVATWLLKTVFSGEVNTQNQGLLQTLFVEPAPPYWFLYVLFFLFVLVPTFSGNKSMFAAAAAALICKLIVVWRGEPPFYLLGKLMTHGIWFVAGMAMAQTNILGKCRGKRAFWLGCGLAAVFLVLSAFVYEMRQTYRLVAFGMGILACTAVVLIMYDPCPKGKNHPIWAFLAQYTMPVFLMHTIFAAGWRAVLMKLGVTNAGIHIVTGLVISFVGPALAAWLMGKVKFLDFFINPGRYVRIGKKNTAVK